MRDRDVDGSVGGLLWRLGVVVEYVCRPRGPVHDGRVDLRQLHAHGELRLLRVERHLLDGTRLRADRRQLRRLELQRERLHADGPLRGQYRVRNLRRCARLRLVRRNRFLRERHVGRTNRGHLHRLALHGGELHTARPVRRERELWWLRGDGIMRLVRVVAELRD